nr:hypothetical protein CFP56_31494 [Quercus suber]
MKGASCFVIESLDLCNERLDHTVSSVAGVGMVFSGRLHCTTSVHWLILQSGSGHGLDNSDMTVSDTMAGLQPPALNRRSD